jgi:hypothetical protein
MTDMLTREAISRVLGPAPGPEKLVRAPTFEFSEACGGEDDPSAPLEMRRPAPVKPRLRAKQDRQGVRPQPGHPRDGRGRQRGAEPRVCWPPEKFMAVWNFGDR